MMLLQVTSTSSFAVIPNDGDGVGGEGDAVLLGCLVQVLARGVEVETLAALGMGLDVAGKFVAKVQNAVTGGRIKSDALLVHLAHGRKAQLVLIATGKEDDREQRGKDDTSFHVFSFGNHGAKIRKRFVTTKGNGKKKRHPTRNAS